MKQVIVVNEALNLPRGKLAAQVAHASVAAFLLADEMQRNAWLKEGMPKIVLACDSLDQLIELLEKAQTLELPAYLIRDGGKTVLEPGTITCLGIGPADSKIIDKATGALKLLE